MTYLDFCYIVAWKGTWIFYKKKKNVWGWGVVKFHHIFVSKLLWKFYSLSNCHQHKDALDCTSCDCFLLWCCSSQDCVNLCLAFAAAHLLPTMCRNLLSIIALLQLFDMANKALEYRHLNWTFGFASTPILPNYKSVRAFGAASGAGNTLIGVMCTFLHSSGLCSLAMTELQQPIRESTRETRFVGINCKVVANCTTLSELQESTNKIDMWDPY